MNAIVAVDNQWGIGKDNDLLFNIPLDMKFFRKTTLNKIVVMGKNTLLSFPESKPLKNRTNIVLSSTMPKRDDCIVVNSLDELKQKLTEYPSQDVFVIGGAMVYETMLDYCDTIYVTKVDACGNAQVFFPNLLKLEHWATFLCVVARILFPKHPRKVRASNSCPVSLLLSADIE